MTSEDLARCIGSVIGAAIGVVIATLLASALLSSTTALIVPSSAGVYGWAQAQMGAPSPVEDREKVMFLGAILLGPLGSYLGARFHLAGEKASFAALAMMVALVPAMTLLIASGLGGSRIAGLIKCGVALALLAGAVVFLRRRALRASETWQPTLPAPAVEPRWALPLSLLVILVAAIPLNAASVAKAIGPEMHMSSYMVGPALYSYAPGLLPGIDYFTQYSIGTPWLFHFLLAPTIDQTMINAVWFIAIQILIFQTILFLFLRWLLKNWLWALVVSMIALLLQFTTPDPLYAPSSTSSRYFLAPLAAWLAALWVKRGFGLRDTAMLAGGLALCLFFNTETGVYACLASAMVTLAARQRILDGAIKTATLAALTFLMLMALAILAFGPGVIDPRFILYYVEPLLIYGGGLGAAPIDWSGPMNWLFSVASPGLALATIGWCVFQLRRATPSEKAEEIAGLMFVAVFGVLLTAKYINQSFVALWQVNAWALVVVGAWWARRALSLLPQRQIGPAVLRADTRMLAELGLAAASFLVLATLDDRNNPSLYAVASYRTYPTLPNKVVNRIIGAPNAPCAGRVGCTSPPVSPRDVELIRTLTPQGGRAAVLELRDWVFLLEAQRAPKFTFMPSVVLFTHRQIEQSLENLDLVFLPREPADKFGINHGVIAEALVPTFASTFERVGEGDDLIAWRRKPASAAQ